jgi:predicted amidophosphoribosyltransferase
MNLGEFVVLVLFLAVLFFVPIVVIQFIGRRKPVFKPNLQECPNCGAENHRAKEQCYCCGHRFGSSPTEGLDATLVQRVKQVDDRRMKRRAAAQPTTATEEKPLPTERALEE